MKARVIVQAGICGFETRVHADDDDEQHVTLELESDCPRVQAFGRALAAHGPVDGYAEIGDGADGVVLTTARQHLQGCCAGCVVPSGVFKGVQVAAAVALPKDIGLTITTA